MTRPTQHPAPNSTARKAETERRANLTVVPCCDAAAAVARVRELADEWDAVADRCKGFYGSSCSICVGRRSAADALRAALDGPAAGGGL